LKEKEIVGRGGNVPPLLVSDLAKKEKKEEPLYPYLVRSD